MLAPKRVKFRKMHKGRMTGTGYRGSEVSYGEYGLKAMEATVLGALQGGATVSQLGGILQTTGAVLSACLFTAAGEWLRFVEEPQMLLGLPIPGIPGMRQVIFSLAMLLVIIFFRQGLLGRREFSWDAAGRLGRRLLPRAGKHP